MRRRSAFRFAEQIVGTLDVDGMLDSIEPRTFDEWLAYRQLEPDPLDRLTEILKLGISLICKGLGVEVTPDELEPETEGGGVSEAMGPAQGAQVMAHYYGPPKRRAGNPDGHGNR